MADTDDLGLGDSGVINKGLLGQGAFGNVYLVENTDKEKFAMKVMQWTSAEPEHNLMAVKELKVLETLNHDNVVVYVNSYILDDRIHIITELCAGGDLGGFLGKLEMANTTVPEDLLLAWLWQMACGLDEWG
ncbi:serine/threonine-protein kinase Nek11-like [Littorina saxatilis]|uniref:serine/threonine-protein kinase Nek11-like n=1 Tax=Littorina saxatilis TaxID=31220 RepID=UPI0038B688A2